MDIRYTRIKLNIEFQQMDEKVAQSTLPEHEKRRIRTILKLKKKLLIKQAETQHLEAADISAVFQKVVNENTESMNLII